ncbi:MAG: pyridoxal 5'-phosphate synthase glutaminase subunit PdxT [bacterium]
MNTNKQLVIGILAFQGDFLEHQHILSALKVNTKLVKYEDELDEIDGLIIPGGESTTMSMLMEEDFRTKLVEKSRQGFPIFGTCAGAILLAKRIIDGTPFQNPLNLIDIEIKRNAYGRQKDSFSAVINIFDSYIRAVFIRAPEITKIGPKVKELASFEELPILVQEDNILVSTFHPELSANPIIHSYFLNMVNQYKSKLS